VVEIWLQDRARVGLCKGTALDELLAPLDVCRLPTEGAAEARRPAAHGGLEALSASLAFPLRIRQVK
jgi:hypothetical protein